MATITKAYLEDQVKLSDTTGRTTPLLRHLVLTCVHEGLKSVFGANYSIRCLQGSFAVQSVLKSLGIESKFWGGSACVLKVHRSYPHDPNFGGFWEEDHHVWAVTEFMELVDLTISQLHLHPGSSRTDGLPIPPIWWDEISRWPESIKYLPDGVARIDLTPEENAELVKVCARSSLTLKQILDAGRDTGTISFEPILSGAESLSALADSGDVWATFTIRAHQARVPMPDWIVNREAELRKIVEERHGS